VKVDLGQPREFREKLTDALYERGFVIYYPDDTWGTPAHPEALRIAAFVLDFMLEGDEPDES
jgi:hypothetical protein